MSSILIGIFSCSDPRNHEEEKRKTVTYDAELLLGKDDNNKDLFVNAVVHFYSDTKIEQDIYHFVVAKVLSIKDDTEVGDAFEVDDYDLELEAFIVRHFPHSQIFLLLLLPSDDTCTRLQ